MYLKTLEPFVGLFFICINLHQNSRCTVFLLIISSKAEMRFLYIIFTFLRFENGRVVKEHDV